MIAAALMGALLLASSIDVARAETPPPPPPGGGDSGCPCIDVSEHLQPYTNRSASTTTCQDHSSKCPPPGASRPLTTFKRFGVGRVTDTDPYGVLCDGRLQ